MTRLSPLSRNASSASSCPRKLRPRHARESGHPVIRDRGFWHKPSIFEAVGDITCGNPLEKVVPVRIRFFDKLNLPLAIPFLHLFFPLNGRFGSAELLKVNQTLDAIFSGESGNKFAAMLVNAPHKIIGDADVKGTSNTARKNVHPE